MTREELNYRSFENRFEYSYLCQPDGGSKSVIFSYVPKGMYELDRDLWLPTTRFEAESLEKAFNYAFHLEGISVVSNRDRNVVFGEIKPFQSEAWNTVIPATHYTTVNGIVKNLQEQLDREAKWREKNEKAV